MRDAYRRSSKNLITVSGQKSKFVKKWKFSDEMEFLKKHMKERECISTVNRVSDDDTELSNSNVEETRSECMSENSDGSLEVCQEVVVPLSKESEKRSAPSTPKLLSKKKMKINKTNIDPTVSTQNASATLMKFILDNRDSKSSEADKTLDALDHFFSSICSTVKQFSPYMQHVAKNKIFSIISELELEQLKYTQPQTYVNTFTDQQPIVIPSVQPYTNFQNIEKSTGNVCEFYSSVPTSSSTGTYFQSSTEENI